MWAAFLLRVLQIAIGSGLGFLFGIWAFHLQQEHQAEKKRLEDWRAALDALNRLTMAAGLNIEALANSKQQLLNDLRRDIELMKPAVDAAYHASDADRANKTRDLKQLAGTLQHFYMNLPRTAAAPAPEVREYSSVLKDMPALAMFAYRAVGMTQELNELIAARNALIADFAHEGGTGNGVTAERLAYFSSMLADQGRAICEFTEYALSCWKLVLDQISYYMKAKAKGQHALEFKLLPLALAALPNDEPFPDLRGQLVMFGCDK